LSSFKKFEVVKTASGEISIRNNVVNEIMHNPVGPWTEANLLYIEASQLVGQLSIDTTQPLILFDVGLGAAANALAAFSAFVAFQRSQKHCRPLTIISFENDLSLLTFIIEQADQIPYVSKHKSILKHLLDHHSWTSSDKLLNWHLYEGDFLKTVGQVSHQPDIVFFDPYSPGVNQDMWSTDAFSKLYACTHFGAHPCAVYTYSCATPVRGAMIAAGFYVGMGPRSGLKLETTQAATDPHLLANPLGQRWLLRWLRSHTRFQEPCSSKMKDAITNSILSHPQFASLHQDALFGWKNATFA